MPALPLDEAGKYVAGAYVVFEARLKRLRRRLEAREVEPREPAAVA